jgi:hypothetical protein
MPEPLSDLCPYCGELIELIVDDSAGAHDYIEDCPVCCRPMQVSLSVAVDGTASIALRRDDDT